MAEKLNDDDLKEVVNAINHLERRLKDENFPLLETEIKLRTKILRIITRQPDPIPYCNCSTGNWSHEFGTPYCKTCYGVPASYNK